MALLVSPEVWLYSGLERSVIKANVDENIVWVRVVDVCVSIWFRKWDIWDGKGGLSEWFEWMFGANVSIVFLGDLNDCIGNEVVKNMVGRHSVLGEMRMESEW